MSRFSSKVTTMKREPDAVDRAQFLDALDGVDDLLDRLGDLRLHLRRARRRAAAC